MAAQREKACGAETRGRRHAAAVVVAIGLFLLTPPVHGRVLPPAGTGVRNEALSNAAMGNVDGIQGGADHAIVRLCLRSAPQTCFLLRLSDPQASCEGDKAGPWCARWEEGDPPGAVRNTVATELQKMEEIWLDPAPGHADDIALQQPTEPSRHLRLRSVALAAALVLLPLAAGSGLGILLRRTRRRWLVLPAALLAIASAWVSMQRVDSVGAWDLLGGALLAVAGLLAGSAHVPLRNWALLLVSSVVALAGLELAVRRWLPSPPHFPPPEDASFVIPPGSWDTACFVLHSSQGIDAALRSLHARSDSHADEAAPRRFDQRPRIAHIGDSMTYGTGVRTGQAFPALLEALQPGVGHDNYGIWAVSTDCEYLMMRRIAGERPPRAVVLHVYTGNDLYEIDRPYECCDAGPLLEYSPAGPTPRCPAPRWRFTLASRLGRSPPPYPLRVATAWSHAARHVAAGFSRLVFQLDVPPNFLHAGEATEAGWTHFEQILAKMRDDLRQSQVTFVVDVLPDQRSLQAGDRRTQERAVSISQHLGIRTLDAWDLFEQGVRQDGPWKYFLAPGDIHFAPDGHRLLAQWLDKQLAAEVGKSGSVGDNQ
ncbi:MAG: SGNH/GDSL hydrolase family protein [Deltaproteobacteria bacterium]|nr:SGNH/GDSL hydrolase family protein [Deltaproteobacteria bacterium]